MRKDIHGLKIRSKDLMTILNDYPSNSELTDALNKLETMKLTGNMDLNEFSNICNLMDRTLHGEEFRKLINFSNDHVEMLSGLSAVVNKTTIENDIVKDNKGIDKAESTGTFTKENPILKGIKNVTETVKGSVNQVIDTCNKTYTNLVELSKQAHNSLTYEMTKIVKIPDNIKHVTGHAISEMVKECTKVQSAANKKIEQGTKIVSDLNNKIVKRTHEFEQDASMAVKNLSADIIEATTASHDFARQCNTWCMGIEDQMSNSLTKAATGILKTSECLRAAHKVQSAMFDEKLINKIYESSDLNPRFTNELYEVSKNAGPNDTLDDIRQKAVQNFEMKRQTRLASLKTEAMPGPGAFAKGIAAIFTNIANVFTNKRTNNMDLALNHTNIINEKTEKVDHLRNQITNIESIKGTDFVHAMLDKINEELDLNLTESNIINGGLLLDDGTTLIGPSEQHQFDEGEITLDDMLDTVKDNMPKTMDS